MTTTSELRSQIERKGEEISQIAHKIETRIEEVVDWKSLVRERPQASLAVAFGTGLLLSGMSRVLLQFAGRQTLAVAKSSAVAYLMAQVQKRQRLSY